MGKGLSVLIVDDSNEVRGRLVDLVARVPGVVRVEEASGAADGWIVLSQRTPDLAVLDIRMPDANGIDLLRRIRREALPTRVVIMTSYPLAPYRQACLRAGADAFLDKSSELDRLVAFIERLARAAGVSQ